MVIRMLGQGESLGTRGCVSVGNEGRASGFDIFEFGDREDICGERKVRKIVRARFISGNARCSLECHSRASFVQRSRIVRNDRKGIRDEKKRWIEGPSVFFFSSRMVLLQVAEHGLMKLLI